MGLFAKAMSFLHKEMGLPKVNASVNPKFLSDINEEEGTAVYKVKNIAIKCVYDGKTWKATDWYDEIEDSMDIFDPLKFTAGEEYELAIELSKRR